MGIEPTSSAWKAEVLPLNYTRLVLPQIWLPNIPFSGAQKILTVFNHTNRLNFKINVVTSQKKNCELSSRLLIASFQVLTSPSTSKGTTKLQTSFAAILAVTFHRLKYWWRG